MTFKKLSLGVLPLALVIAAACESEEPYDDDEDAASADAVAVGAALQGAWKTVEFSFSSPDTSYTISDPQPSLMLFLKGHYSQMYVPGSEPRQLFAGDQPVLGAAEPTDAEKLVAFVTFIANSGTYEVTSSTITTHPIVAKNPNFMSGGSLTYTYEIDGDTLRLTIRTPWEPDTEDTYVLTRLE